MVATQSPPAARKPRRSRQRMLSQEARRKLFLETLEDRRLLAGLDEALVTGEWSVVSGPSSLVTGHWSAANDQGLVTIDQFTNDQGQVTNDYARVRRELVIIDAATPNYRQLVEDVIQNPDGTRQFDLLLLDSNADGVAALGRILAQYRDLDAVHLISHGSPGQVQLGNAVLSSETLTRYADSIRGWAGSLKPNADILVYGCDVAAGETGAGLVAALAGLTGADVAASSDTTGNAALGGDWDLEYAAGVVDASSPLSAEAQGQWSGRLGSTSVFYIPLLEENAQSIFDTVNSNAGTSIFNAISIVATVDNSIVLFDHADDGFEASDLSVGQASTEVWGDNDPGNGIPPGFATDLLNAGDVITLEQVVSLPHDPNVIHWDGGDKIISSAPLAVTRTLYPVSPGPVNSGAVEVFPVDQWGTSYRLPVGENITNPTLFEMATPFIMAVKDATTVVIDLNDGDSTTDITVTLDQGEEYYVPVGTVVKAGATITANNPIQVHLATGDINSQYEVDWLAMVPRDRWTNDYYTPVGLTEATDPPVVFLYNPNATALTINWQTQSSSGTFSIPAASTNPGNPGATGNPYQFTMPGNTGARFYAADGRAFSAIQGMDLKGSDGTDADYDWGFPLIPAADLTSSVVVGWGPGVDPLDSQYGTANGSPVWVTTSAAATVYIDLDGDPSTGPNFDPYGNRYNTAVSLAALQSYRVFDTTDNDQTGMRVYTVDGSKIAVAWGEDPSASQIGNPYLDIGTWVLPTPALILDKSATTVTDANGNGYSDAGDTIRYTLTVRNVGVIPVTTSVLLDTLPAYANYVPNSTTLDARLTVRDEFSAVSYANNDGTQNWGGSWIEAGDDLSPSAGNASIVGGALRLDDSPNNTGAPSVAREVNLSAATSATLGFNYALVDAEAGDTADVQYSTNGGASWTTIPLATYSGTTTGYGTFTLPGPLTSNYQIRFRVTGGFNESGEYFQVDNVQVAYQVVGQALPDNVTPDTPFPIDGSGLTLPEMVPGATTVVKFLATIDPAIPSSVSHLLNTATVTSSQGDATVDHELDLYAIKQLYLSDPGQSLDRRDPVAAGDTSTSTYSLPAATATTATYRDNFAAAAYNNTNGTVNWSSTPWTETNDNNSATSGDIFVDLGRLSISNGSGGAFPSITRPVDLSAASSAVLSFDYSAGSGPFESDDQVTLDVSNNGGVSWTTVRTFNGAPGSGSDNVTLQSFAALTANYRIRFRVSGDYDGGGEILYIDNLQITYPTGVNSSSVTFTQTPGMALPFTMNTGDVTVRAYARPSGSVLPTSADVIATLKSGATTIANDLAAEVSLVSTGTSTVADNFSPSGSYAGSNGNVTWTPVWTETGESDGAGAGTIQVVADDPGVAGTNPVLRFDGTGGTDRTLARQVNLTGALVASLSFNFRRVDMENVDRLYAEASSDGTTWLEIGNVAGGGSQTDATYIPFSAPLPSSTLGSTPYIRLRMDSTTPNTDNDGIYIDDVVLRYGIPVYQLTWADSLDAVTTVPAGTALTLTLTNLEAIGLEILYDSSTYPSQVLLPATTIIHVDSVGIYNGAYTNDGNPANNGTQVTTLAPGGTYYARVAVSDPFGDYDITNLRLLLENSLGADILDVTLIDTSVVDGAPFNVEGIKTYQYQFTAPATLGDYRITATANEGTEGISDSEVSEFSVVRVDIEVLKEVSIDGGATWQDANAVTGPTLNPGTNPQFRFTVTNPGSVALSVTLTDTDFTPNFISGDTDGDGRLDTTETWIYRNTGTWALGQHANTATAIGSYTDGSGNTTTDTDSDNAHYFGANPDVTVLKEVSINGGTAWFPADVAPGPYSNAGTNPQFRFTVFNTGNVPLSNVGLSDSDFNLSACTIISPLPVGGSFSCTIAAPWAAGQHANRATASGSFDDDTSNPPRTDTGTDDAHYFGSDPEINVIKEVSVNGGAAWFPADSAPGPFLNAGTDPQFRFTVSNTGNVGLSNVTLSDSDFSLSGCTIPSSLPVSGSFSCTITAPRTAGQHTNTATASGGFLDDKGNTETDTDTDNANYFGSSPGIQVIKEISIDSGTNWLDASVAPFPNLNQGTSPQFRFRVTNTGNVELSNITLSDPYFPPAGITFAGGDLDTDSRLDTSETWTYTASGTWQAGPHVNTATVSGTFTDQNSNVQTPTDTDDAHYFGSNPQIDVEKFVSINNGGSWADADSPTGDYLNSGTFAPRFEFYVTNVGNVPLSNVALTDSTFTGPNSPTLVSGDDGDNVLELGETWTYAATGTWAAGQHANTASVSGSFTDDNNQTRTDTDSDDAHYFGSNPQIDVEKYVSINNGSSWADADTPTGPDLYIGTDPQFRFVVRNTGNVTLSAIDLDDSLITAFRDITLTTSCTIPATLAPNATFVCYASLPWQPGQHANTATASGSHTDTNGNTRPASDTDDAHYLGLGGGIVVVKEVSVDNGASWDDANTAPGPYLNNTGTNPRFRFTVTNTGNAILNDVTLSDPFFPGMPGCTPPNPLSAGDSYSCIIVGTWQAGQHANSVEATGTAGGTPYTDYDDAYYFGSVPAINLNKVGTLNLGGDGHATPGDLITYTFTVTNTGNVTLTNVALADPLPGITLSALGDTGGDGVTVLAPGATETATGTYAITQADINAGLVNNTATVNGNDPLGGSVTDSDPHTEVVPQVTTINLDKIGTLNLGADGRATPGDVITYTLTVTNTGNTTLSNVTLSDPLPGIALGALSDAGGDGVNVLAPGAVETATATYAITQADINAGIVNNTATVSGQDPQGDPATDSDPHSETVPQVTTINLDKVGTLNLGADGRATPGDVITYTLTVTNTGNTTLSSVALSDPLAGIVLGALSDAGGDGVNVLAPGAVETATATYAITQADINAGIVNNTATVSGQDPQGVPATDSDPHSETVPQVTTINLDKVGTLNLGVDGRATPGDVITYTLTVTNTGNTTLSSVTLNDPLPGIALGELSDSGSDGVSVLAPGAVATATATYAITQADIDAGIVNNTATVSGQDPQGDSATDSDPHSEPVPQTPAIALVKAITDIGGDGPFGVADAAGEVISYRITVTNTGNQTIESVVVTDPLIPTLTRGLDAPGNNDGNLDVGEVWVYAGSYAVQQIDLDTNGDGDGDIDNTATVTTNRTPPQDASAEAPVQPARGTIGDRIWLDENGDGIQDAGEDGIANVTVELYDSTGTVLIATTVTGWNGDYLFSDLIADDYVVSVNTATMPAGLAANPTHDPDGGVANETVVTLGQGQEYVTADFGYNWTTDPTTNTGPGSIGDRVWIDADSDGVQDAGEAGLSGTPVQLFRDADGNGTYETLVATQTTDADGSYVFDDVPPGAYQVAINGGVTPAGYVQTGDPDGVLNNATLVVLSPGDVYVNADFGYDPGAGSAIGDLIFVDTNGDGNWDAGEPGVAGVTVTLLNNVGQVVATDVTDVNGNYLFPGLPAGDYTVVVTDTGNVLGVLVPSADPDTLLDNRTTVTVNGTANVLTADLGYAPAGQDPGEGLIGDTIFLDRDGGNDFDPGEGLEGVTVRLYSDPNGDGNPTDGVLLQTTETNENGQYFFGGLAAGSYVVAADPGTLPGDLSQLTNTYDPDGGTANQVAVTLTVGEIDLTADLGYLDPASPNTISGTIWRDADADGTLDAGEPGRYEGVTVVLRDADGDIVATEVTDANGLYTFSGLPDGTYTVDVTDGANVLGGTWHSLGGDSEPDPTGPIIVSGGQTADADFGYYRDPASVGDFVWVDLDGDGLQDAGEPGLNGIPVTLTVTYPNGTTTTVVTVTGDNPATPGVEIGWYSLGNLLTDEDFDGVGTPGAGGDEPLFVIHAATPAGYAPSPSNVGSDDAVDSDLPSGQIVSLTRGQSDLTVDFGFRLEADLVIFKTDGSATYTPGSPLTYTITVTNNGPSNAVGATVADTLPANLTNVTWTSSVTGGASISSGGSGSGNNLAATVSVPAGAGNSVVFTVSGTVLASATGNLVNTATVTPPAGTTDPTPGNNSSTDTDTPAPRADLVIFKTDGSATYTPGSPLTYTITVTNNGPSNAVGATVADTLPANLTNVTWTSSVTGGASVSSGGSGSGNSLAATVSVPAGAGNSVVFTVSGTVLASATGNLVNTATVTPPVGTTDPTPGNNSSTDTDTPAPRADLIIFKTDGSATYTPGSPLTYTITVTNNGPSNAVGATVADTLPANLTNVTWTSSVTGGASVSSGGSGTGNNLAATVSVPAGAGNSVVFTVSGTVLASATGNLVNTATVTPPVGTTDPTPGNNSSTDTDTPAPRADLVIFKTDGSATYTPGSPLTYTITVTNNGPSNAVGATVADTLPANLTNVTWTSSVTGGASISSGGSGSGNSLAATVSVPAGAGNSVVFTVSGTVLASATGNLVNTATVTPPAGTTDPTPGNNSSTDTDTPAPRADLVIFKTDGSATYTPGSPLTYTITVTNNGPSNAVGAMVADTLPANLTNVTWTSSVTGGASVSSGGSGSGNNLAATVSVPAGAGNSVVFTVSGTVLASATGNLVNTATVTPPAGTTDPTPGNNSSTDTDTPAPVADLVIFKTDGSATYTPGSPLTYTITVTNSGPSNATGATVSDLIPAAITGVTWTSSASGGASVASGASGSGNTLSATVNVPAGGGSVTFAVTGMVSASAIGDLVNTAMVSPPAGTTDPDPSDNSSTDTDTRAVLGAIGNRVWLDEDGDGLQDAGEAGIGGLTVRLTPPAGVNLGAGAGQPITTVTGTDGGYLFPGLPAGQYTVTVVPTAGLNQTGDPDATLNNATTVSLAAGQEVVTADFGYNWVPRTDSTNPGATATGAIGDRIWNDANGDGVQDPGETGLPGVTVRLLRDTNGDGIYGGVGDTGTLTTTTDVRGQYIFDGIAPGAYVIDVNTAGLPAGWSATPTGDPDGDGDTTSEPIIIAPGDVYVLGDFGFQPSPAATSYTIGDQVFVDIDGDGVLDIGEPVIPGVTVNLLNAGGQVLATTVTDENGQYEFPNLAATPGTVFTVQVTDTDHVLGELAPISDRDGTLDNRTTVTIVAGTTEYPTADFGYAPPGHAAGDGLIGSTVFLDRDGNGAYTPGEGIEGVTVWLYDATATTLLGTTATDENGNYYFGGLDPGGTYRVIVDGAGIPGGAQSMVNPPGSPGPNQGQVNLAVDSDKVNLDQDFGYGYIAPDSSAGDITGTIWSDTSADGTLDGMELGRYANVEVVLRDSDGNVVAITTTNSTGFYSFLNVPPGSYTVDVVENGPVLDGLWHSAGVNSQVDPAPVTVVAGGVYTLDFGYYADPAAIGDRVWVDSNGNGIQDVGEVGIGDVPVTLRITYPNGAVTTVVTRTDAAGNYLFPNLLLDETFDGLGANEPTYTVSMATPTGMTPTGISVAGSTAANDSNNPAGAAATVGEGLTNDTIDFGFRYNGSLSGVVYDNTDGDLVRDSGEAGMSGVTVYLDSNNNGALDAGEPTTTTNSSGQYTFSYLAPGTYYVRQLVPNGTSQTAPLNNAAMVEDLAVGEVATGLNFGNTPPPGTILDDGDPGVTYPGWFVSYCPLFFNADGRYLCNAAGTMTWSFSGLAAGSYRVSTTWLAGSAFTNAATYQISSGSSTTTAGPYSQQLPPSSYPGYSASGFYWADLTTAITVPAGGTLTVSLAAPATGCVNGDAVRIVPASTPEITVLNGTAALTDGGSTVNMGSTGGSPITYTFTVRNDGGGTLNLGTLSVPTGFTSTNPLASSLAPGGSTTFTITLPASLAAGTYGGQVVLGTNDNDEAPFDFTIQGTVGGGSPIPQPSAPVGAPPPAPPAAAATIDLSQGGTLLANGISTVDFGSVAVGGAASRTFTVTNTSTLDVELATPSLPAGFTLSQAYGDASLTPGQSTTFVVGLATGVAGTFSGNMVLSTTGGEGLFSVQVAGTVTQPTVPAATKAIIDDGDAGFTAGGFTTYSSGSGYLGDVRYATQNTVESKVAQWQFSLPGLGLADGLYRVSTLWYVESSRASQATFKMYSGAASGTPQTTAVVNQQVAPRADVVDEGRNWQDLGVVLVSGGVLTVTVSDLAVGGAVVADAIRIERVVTPEIQLVLDSTGADLVDGSGVVNFGSVFAGATSQLTLRVKNVGTGTVTLAAPTLAGTGFTLVSGPASTSLSANDGAAGGADETTLTIALNTSTSGSKSGTLSLVNSDANENPFDLTLQGTVSSVKIIDDGDSGFVQSGPSAWLTWADGYQGDLRYSAKNTGRSATWTFTDLPNGTYRVSTTWVKNSNRATNAPYTISDGGGTVLVNQELAPNSSAFTWLLESGKYFADLAAGVAVSDGTLVISLTDVGANEYVVADAVRIERLSPLLSSAEGASPQSAAPALESVPAQTVARAIAYWASEDVAAAATLSAATILVADLPERHLGLASSVTNTVWLDADAAGYGWELGRGQSSFVSGEGAGNIQAGGVDLWHVLTHEFGHLLGLDDLDADEHAGELMAGEFSPQPWQLPVLSIPGVRRLELSDLAWDGSELLNLRSSLATASVADRPVEPSSALTSLVSRQASEAALLAWAEDDDEDGDEFLTALGRDDEDEHTGRVDRVFEASGDWDLAPLAWATENSPRGTAAR